MDELFGEIRTEEGVGRTVRHVTSSVHGWCVDVHTCGE